MSSLTTTGGSTTWVVSGTGTTGGNIIVSSPHNPITRVTDPKKLKILQKEENLRIQNQKSCINKFVVLDNGRGTVGKFCLNQSDKALFVISLDGSLDVSSYSLDLTDQYAYKILEVFTDKKEAVKLAHLIVDKIQVDLDNDKDKPERKFTFKKMLKYCGVKYPEMRIFRHQNLPQVIDNRIVLSRNMSRILGTYCEENRKKATALVEQIYSEMLGIFVPALQEMGCKVPERLCLPAPLLALPEPDKN